MIVCCWVPNWLLLLLLLVLELALARRDFVYYWCGLLLLLLLLRLGQRGLLGGRLLGRIRHLLGGYGAARCGDATGRTSPGSIATRARRSKRRNCGCETHSRNCCCEGTPLEEPNQLCEHEINSTIVTITSTIDVPPFVRPPSSLPPSLPTSPLYLHASLSPCELGHAASLTI